MRVLALEPYYGGSHRAFLDGWRDGSAHDWTLLTLPPFKWKWRMRHAAVTFAADVAERHAAGERWEVLFCSDMLSLAELLGLAPEAVRTLPAVVYFHENQLTYPVQVEKERDLHFALTNLTSALAADAVWFNSGFHRDELLAAWPRLLRKMPDHRPFAAIDAIAARSAVEPPAVASAPPRHGRRPGPLRIVWAARWEFDKDPETFFAALGRLQAAERPFRVSVLGESFRRVPEIFARARDTLGERVKRWGWLERRADYLAVLADADVIVSTARHEFFGLAVVEAMTAGCAPLLPDRLAYPELLAKLPASARRACLYDGSVAGLAERLDDLATEIERGPLATGGEVAAAAVAAWTWPRRRPLLDAALERVAAGG